MSDEEKVVLKVEISMSKEFWERWWKLQGELAPSTVHMNIEPTDHIIIDEQEVRAKDEDIWIAFISTLSSSHAIHKSAQMMREVGL